MEEEDVPAATSDEEFEACCSMAVLVSLGMLLLVVTVPPVAIGVCFMVWDRA